MMIPSQGELGHSNAVREAHAVRWNRRGAWFPGLAAQDGL